MRISKQIVRSSTKVLATREKQVPAELRFLIYKQKELAVDAKRQKSLNLTVKSCPTNHPAQCTMQSYQINVSNEH